MAKPLRVFLILFALCLPGFALRRDVVHYSQTLHMNRNFRIYMPSSYDSSGSTRYPVIYYCHGCAGSYRGDSYADYDEDGGYQPPYYCIPTAAPGCDPVLNKPFNADFQMFADSHAVLIVMLDGTGPGGSCNAWYPYGIFDSETGYTGNEYDFARYIRDLVRTVDSLFPTRAEPRYRALSGLSMGGANTLWLAAANPSLFQSASTFCFSPPFWLLGAAPYTTAVDPTQLWRNYRGIAMRATANDQDYLYQYSQELGMLFTRGPGFSGDYHLAEFFRHWAADIDSQFLYHLKTFEAPKIAPACFSHMNLFPSFDVWDYSVQSGKNAPGWIFLKDVTPSGFGLVTREWFPYGKPCPDFDITLTTAPVYSPGGTYRVVKYNYRTDSVSVSDASADPSGRLTFTSQGGQGDEFGICGGGLEPAVVLLADTVNELITVKGGQDVVWGGDLINLTEQTLYNLSVQVTTETPFLTIKPISPLLPIVPPKHRIRLPRLVSIRGNYIEHDNFGYLKVRFGVSGKSLAREQIIPVQVADSMPWLDSTQVMVLDGRIAKTSVFSSGDNGGIKTLTLEEGEGNGDGHPDSGEVVSVWVQTPRGYAPSDRNTWHPVMPLNQADNQDVSLIRRISYSLNRGRSVLSGQFRLNRQPTIEHPIDIPLRSEMVYTMYSAGSAKNIDSYTYRYFKLRLPLSLAIGVESPEVVSAGLLSLKAAPNPFQPFARLVFSLPNPSAAFTLRIWDAAGRQIRLFSSTEASREQRGIRSIIWDLKDDSGKTVSPGVYLAGLESSGKRVVAKLVTIR